MFMGFESISDKVQNDPLLYLPQEYWIPYTSLDLLFRLVADPILSSSQLHLLLVSCGVPQSQLPETLLFLLWAKNLLQFLSFGIVMCAD